MKYVLIIAFCIIIICITYINYGNYNDTNRYKYEDIEITNYFGSTIDGWEIIGKYSYNNHSCIVVNSINYEENNYDDVKFLYEIGQTYKCLVDTYSNYCYTLEYVNESRIFNLLVYIILIVCILFNIVVGLKYFWDMPPKNNNKTNVVIVPSAPVDEKSPLVTNAVAINSPSYV